METQRIDGPPHAAFPAKIDSLSKPMPRPPSRSSPLHAKSGCGTLGAAQRFHRAAKNGASQVLHNGCLRHLIPTLERHATITPVHSQHAEHAKIATLHNLTRTQSTASSLLEQNDAGNISCHHGMARDTTVFASVVR